MRSLQQSRSSRGVVAVSVLALVLLLGVTALYPADARPGFGGRTAHFNAGSHFNGPRSFGQVQPRPPRPPEPRPRPPGPEPRPKPGPGPHPPRPIPPPLPPVYPGYWPAPYPWYGDYPWPAEALVTTLAIGTLVSSLPSGCRSVAVSGITYELCGSTWYAPRFSGNQLVYVVVQPPT